MGSEVEDRQSRLRQHPVQALYPLTTGDFGGGGCFLVARSLGIDSFDAIEESPSHIVYRVEDAGVQNIDPPFFFELVQLSAE